MCRWFKEAFENFFKVCLRKMSKLRYLYKASNHLENYKLNITASFDKFLKLLKTRGPQSSSQLSMELGMTVEGARFQLTKLAEEGIVEVAVESKGVGRPTQVWKLTDKGNQYFPDKH